MDLTSKVCQIFEYLLSVKNLSEKVIKNIDDYDKICWEKDLPSAKGCYLNGSGEFKEAWLEVHKNDMPEFYNNLFTIHQKLSRESENIELVWGHGLLSWNIKGECIKRPMIVTPLELRFDAKQGVFMMIPTSKGTYMETDMLNNIKLPYPKKIQNIERNIRDCEIDVWNKETMETLLKEIINTINPEGKYVEEFFNIDKKTTVPIITYSPVIFMRKKGFRIWENELKEAIEKIKAGYEVPDTLKMLVTDNPYEYINHDKSKEEWDKLSEDLLFPLPYNNEQKLIIQKLASNCGVIVQGPPGTGKSHTIANLICHLLAHGKRILVTSEKERALKVLKNKIPEEIRNLCVSVLGSDLESVKEIENSVKNIIESIDSCNPEILEKEIKRIKMDLYSIGQKIDKFNNLIKHIGELENTVVKIGSSEVTPLEMGKWLNENNNHNWLPDSIDIKQNIPLNKEELETFFKLTGILRKDDIKKLELSRPEINKMPTPETFKYWVNDINELKDEFDNKKIYIRGWNVSEDIYQLLSTLKIKVTTLIRELDTINEPWIKIILQDSVYENPRKELWKEFSLDIHEKIKTINELDRDLVEYEIFLPEGISPIIVKEDLISLKNKHGKSISSGWMFKSLMGRKYTYLMEKISINGVNIRKEEDIDLVIKYIERAEIKKRLLLKWNHTMKEIGGPQLSFVVSKLIVPIEDLMTKFDKALNWKEDKLDEVISVIDKLGINDEHRWIEKEWLNNVYFGIKALEAKSELNKSSEKLNNLIDFLFAKANQNEKNEIWNGLLEACSSKSIDKWEEKYDELKRLEVIKDQYITWSNLRDKLYKVAPNFTNSIMESGGNGNSIPIPSDLELAWKWSQYNNYINKIHEKGNIENIQRLLETERKIQVNMLKDLVAKSTWLSQIKRTTLKQKRSLYAWMKAIQRIGKGTGKYVNIYKKEASKEMKTCKGAIPVWIMPVEKVIENIEFTEELFDVIIIDESSQSDLFALSTLLRAKRAIIVGDENQISPEIIGTNIGDVYNLIDRYLEGIPQSNRFELKTSLYEIGNQVFDSKVVLKEHFRSVPEIVQFNNNLMYDGKMVPLRQPMSNEILNPPICSVYMENGVREQNTHKAINKEEAIAIVNHIKDCCSNPAYKNKTIGVISLQGIEQAQFIEELLRKEIGEEEMLSRGLLCGDSYLFQGDERDVIFLSMVISTNIRIGALTKISDYQRFNVAVSRARDQIFLYHSVKLTDLNPKCVRYKMLQYFENPYNTNEEIAVEYLFKSQLEEDVYKIIKDKGYKVIPQVTVGTIGEKLDMVIEGDRCRIAVECDGDKWYGIDKWQEEIERQRVLERVGWNFYRITGSMFYRDPKNTMESLFNKLKELGIKPIKDKQSKLN